MSQDAQRREEELRRKVADAESKIGAFSGRLMFSDELDGLAGRQARLDELAASLSKARTRGYYFSATLEPTLAAARSAARPAIEAARAEADATGRALRSRVDDAAHDAHAVAGWPRLSDQAHRVESLEREAEALETAASQAEQRITAAARPFCEPFDTVEKALRDVHKVLDAFDSRSFDMVPEESPVAAIKATWLDPPSGEKMEGLLLFSDHRLRFEQREERVTKRKLLIFAAEKEMVQKCWVDEPIGHVASSQDKTKGLLIKDQLLVLEWATDSRAPRSTTFELSGTTAKEADALVESIRSGEIVRQRWGGTVTAVVEERLEFPSKCVSCGASLPVAVKGQTVLACGYCGHQHPGRPLAPPPAAAPASK